MAVVTKTLKRTGGDYSLMSTWESTEQTDLVTAGDTHVLECYEGDGTVSGSWNASGELVNDPTTISGWTTSATNDITIMSAAGNRFDKGVGGFAMISTSTSPQIGATVGHITIEGIRFYVDSVTNHQTGCISLSNGVSVTKINACWFQFSGCGGGTGKPAALYHSDTSGAFTQCIISNCVFKDVFNSDYPTSTVNATVNGGYASAQSKILILNGTLVNCGRAGNYCTFENTVSVDSKSGDFSSTSGITQTGHNASKDTSASGTGSVTGVNTSTDFVDYAGGDYTPASGSTKLAGTGTDLSTYFDDDITGALR